jgi:hypothetical protein
MTTGSGHIDPGSDDPNIDEVMLDRVRRRSGPGVDTQLVEDVADVTMHGSFAQEQLARDRMVCPACGTQHLDLACA